MKRSVEILADVTGLPIVSAKNLVDATQTTDAYTEISSTLKICMLNISKIANDLRLMSSGPRAGFNEIELPARQPGSSIMPGKVNPVMCEVVSHVAFQVAGNDQSFSAPSEAREFEVYVMDSIIVFTMTESLKMMTRVTTFFKDYGIEVIQANIDKCKEDVEGSI